MYTWNTGLERICRLLSTPCTALPRARPTWEVSRSNYSSLPCLTVHKIQCRSASQPSFSLAILPQFRKLPLTPITPQPNSFTGHPEPLSPAILTKPQHFLVVTKSYSLPSKRGCCSVSLWLP
ncbi:hypothetical protein E2C01_032503 [Portunus trituberculatus]|uniref:Uncharacterized protein n=1 Tax=Portunus trituberculatus TaxID=210409 RepID=A0A5B7F2Z7_PORTR|nr:hypothetical protein [Portunus trituberculatus]